MSRLPPATGIILGTNIVVFLALAAFTGELSFDGRTIAAFGGLMPLEWLEGQYWRLLTAGFLHFSLMHIAANSLCLVAWGAPLESMLGTIRFAFVYLGSIVLGGVASLWLHDEPFISAGASGGVSGLLGALLGLQLARRIDLPAKFFAINIGLNIVVAVMAPSIDWQAHLGGFLGGMALVSVLRPRRG